MKSLSKRKRSAFRREVELLLKQIKGSISADEDPLLVTIGASVLEDSSVVWGWQTGDNSFTGGAYGFPHWVTVDLYRGRGSNCVALSEFISQEISEMIKYSLENERFSDS